jgi:outer membrane receptor protein involved in Fe transport
MRFIGSRFGLANDSQEVKSYFLADLNAAYDLGTLMHIKGLSASLSVENIFNGANARYLAALGSTAGTTDVDFARSLDLIIEAWGHLVEKASARRKIPPRSCPRKR